VTRSRAGRPLAGTLVYTALLVVLLVIPTGARHQRRGYLQEYSLTVNRRLVADVAANLVLFVPLGWGVCRTGRALGVAPATMVPLAGGIVLGFSLIMEGVQLFLPRRYSSLVDVVADTAGGLLGAWLESRRPR
jgi:glycopeptide antibiotics resistance protein